MSTGVTLHAASHWRIEYPFAPELDCLRETTALLGRCAGIQARKLAQSQATQGKVPENFMLCSTVLSGICPQAVPADALRQGVESGSGTKPIGFLRAYECSGWAFALRFFASCARSREVMITILDADLHRSSTFAGDEQWGRSGFGVTSLLLTLPEDITPALTVGRSERRAGTWGSDTRTFANLVQAVRQRRSKGTQEMIFVHFMASHIRGALEQVLGTDNISRNRFTEYGHCFGADPWMGIIEWIRERAATGMADRRAAVTAASLSNNGYYVLCDVDIAPHAYTELTIVDGRRASIEQMIEQSLEPAPLHREETLCRLAQTS